MVAGQPMHDARRAGIGIICKRDGGGFNNHDRILGKVGGPDHEQGYAVVDEQGKNII